MIRPFVTILTLAGALAAQIPALPSPVPVQLCPDPSVSAGVPVQMIALDADRDLIMDLVVRWSDGKVTFVYAPEILETFVVAPITEARSIARMGGAHAPPGATGRDGFLVADDLGIGFVDLDTSTGVLQRHTIVATAPWNTATMLHCSEHLGVAFVLALDPDKRTVRLGQMFGSIVFEVATFLAADDVQEMLVYDPLQDGNLRVAVRTRSALQVWLANGTVEASIAAPTASAQGGLTVYRQGGVQKLAWVALSGQQWLLRTYEGVLPGQTLIVDPQGHAPSRFRMVALHSFAVPGNATDGLVVQQNSTPNQLVLKPNGAGAFAMHAAFHQPYTTLGIDNCPALCVDVDRDLHPDWTVMMSSTRCLQMWRDLTRPAQPTPLPMLGDDTTSEDDYLPEPCWLDATTSPFPVRLLFETPLPRLPANPTHVHVQAVLWHQHVYDPTSGVQDESNCIAVTATSQHLMFPIGDGSSVLASPELLLSFPAPSGTSPHWLPNDHFYLMLRVVGLDTDVLPDATIQWSTTPHMFALVVDTSDPELSLAEDNLGFAVSLCNGEDPARVDVKTPGGPRHVGVILKPRRLSPPCSTLVVPAARTADPGIVLP